MSALNKAYPFQSKTEREHHIQTQINKEEEDILKDYIIGETLGKGTFGKVKLGKHKITGEKVIY